jgi:hypothetical protein
VTDDKKSAKKETDKVKRADTRMRQVDAGVIELEQWLEDQVRNGIMDTPAKIYQFTSSIKARMEDAKAAGLATLVRNLEKINFFAEGWQIDFLQQLVNIQIVLDIYKNLDAQSIDFQQDIKNIIGWNIKKDEVLATEKFGDQWVCLAREVVEEYKGLTAERCWLWGVRSNKVALILNYAGGYGPPLTTSHEVGKTYIGDLCYYPSAFPMRALFFEMNETAAFQAVNGFKDFSTFFSSKINLQKRYPLLKALPVVFSNVNTLIANKKVFIVDNQSFMIEVTNDIENILPIFAASSGMTMSVFGLFENEKLKLLSAWIGNDFYKILK